MFGFLNGSYEWDQRGRFLNRYDAGRALASALKSKVTEFQGKGVVVGLPRGGLMVGLAVSNDLGLPLDFRAVKKVGHPYQMEFAIGAVDISGVAVKNPMVHPSEMVSDTEFERLANKALEQAKELDLELREGKPVKTADADWCLVVDDGAATGLTIIAVTRGLKAEGKQVHVAVPVASEQAQNLISREADSFFALIVPRMFMAVSQFYEDFGEVTTEQARRYL